MRNFTSIKKVLVMIIMVSVICLATNVFAATEFNSLSDLNSSSIGTGAGATNLSGNTATPIAGNTATTLTPSSGNTSLNTTPTTNIPTNTTPVNNAAPINTTPTPYNNNNNSNLPDTGLQDSLPIVVLIAVCGISAIYAFKKVREYQSL